MLSCRGAGFTIVPEGEEADVFVVNSCTVTNFGDQKSRKWLRRAKRENPGAVTVLTGCYPQAFPEEAAQFMEADLVCGNGDRKAILDNVLKLLAAADLVISRAGALTLAELEAVGRAAVLIPSPNVAENHQYYNAMELQKAGAAVVIEEKDLTGEKLVQTVSGMLAQPGKLAEMGRNARSLSVDDSLDRIADALLKLVKTP